MLLIKKEPFSFKKLGKKAAVLFLSGAAMGLNWVLLFEAYNHTTVATATLCYYMAPVFVILASPFIFGEKLGAKKVLCVLFAVLGMFFVSGVFESGFGGAAELKGVLFGISAAVLYATVVILNKKTAEVPSFEKTLVQLGSAAITILPYILLTEDFSEIEAKPLSLALLLTAGIVHTGIAYALYFGSIGKLPAQTTAIFSYIDPVSALFISVLFLHEPMGAAGLVGAVLILGAAFAAER
jgi:RarD protein